MKLTRIIERLLFAGCLLVLGNRAAAISEFYIATDGDDNNPGTTTKPLASLGGARDAIRAMKQKGALPEGGVTVWIRGGAYGLERTFKLSAEDSGTEQSPIIYRAYPDEKVVLSGGKEVKGFKLVQDAEKASRLDPAARGKVFEANLKQHGITNFGTMGGLSLELFFNGKPMNLARWPNTGWTKITGVPEGHGKTFNYDGDRPSCWTQSEDAWLYGYWAYDWFDSYVKVETIDTQKRTITARSLGLIKESVGQRYLALNLIEELDEPGEWYLDRQRGILYFWPPSPVGQGQAIVSVLEDTLISLQQVSHVTFRGLIFEAGRGSGAEIVGGTHNLLAGCTFHNLGQKAVWIGPVTPDLFAKIEASRVYKGDAGTGHGIVSCDIYDIGEGGIVLQGGDRLTLSPGSNSVDNCIIHDCNRRLSAYHPPVNILGVGNRLSHNLVYNSPQMGLYLHGNDHLIEFNDLHHCGLVCLGGIYMGQDFSERGNLMRYNWIHDMGEKAGGIGFDDFGSGNFVFGNLFHKMGNGIDTAAVVVGGGRDNTIENNIFVDCDIAGQFDARGVGWAKATFDGSNTWIFQRLHAVNYKQPPYSVRYPELVRIAEDEPALPKGNSFIRNIISGGRGIVLLDGLDKRNLIKLENNLIDKDPHFVDAAGRNFRLSEDSPAFKLGFKPIPLDRIGPRPDPYRAHLNYVPVGH